MVPVKSITLVILATTVSFDREIDGYHGISLASFQSLDESNI